MYVDLTLLAGPLRPPHRLRLLKSRLLLLALLRALHRHLLLLYRSPLQCLATQQTASAAECASHGARAAGPVLPGRARGRA